jgi:hypothetical protein
VRYCWYACWVLGGVAVLPVPLSAHPARTNYKGTDVTCATLPLHHCHAANQTLRGQHDMHDTRSCSIQLCLARTTAEGAHPREVLLAAAGAEMTSSNTLMVTYSGDCRMAVGLLPLSGA